MDYNNYAGYTPFTQNTPYQTLPQTYYSAAPQNAYGTATPALQPAYTSAFPFTVAPPPVRRIGDGVNGHPNLSVREKKYSTRSQPVRSNTVPALTSQSMAMDANMGGVKRSTRKHRTYRRTTPFNRAFITLRGHSEIIFEHFPPKAMQSIVDTLRVWAPGFQEEADDEGEELDHMWIVKLNGKPWRADGPHLQEACELIVKLFVLLNKGGYMFQTLIGAATQDPRLVFFEISTDLDSSFFTAYFSRKSRRVNFQTSLIPAAVLPQIIAGFRSTLLHAKQVNEEDPSLLCFEIETNQSSRYMTSKVGRRPRPPPPEVDPDLFFVHVIQILSDIGYNVVTSICLKRSKKMMFTPPMELLIFRDKTSNRRA